MQAANDLAEIEKVLSEGPKAPAKGRPVPQPVPEDEEIGGREEEDWDALPARSIDTLPPRHDLPTCTPAHPPVPGLPNAEEDTGVIAARAKFDGIVKELRGVCAERAELEGKHGVRMGQSNEKQIEELAVAAILAGTGDVSEAVAAPERLKALAQRERWLRRAADVAAKAVDEKLRAVRARAGADAVAKRRKPIARKVAKAYLALVSAVVDERADAEEIARGGFGRPVATMPYSVLVHPDPGYDLICRLIASGAVTRDEVNAAIPHLRGAF